jgi:hypothetical protein
MSLPDPPPRRKLSRLGLYAPFALALVLVAAWTAAWLWARGEARARMDAAVADLRRAGYEVSWKERGLGGYPYRLNVTLTEARVREPSGWALEAPKLEAQAYLHAPTQWVVAAPQGAVFVRPLGGPVRVTGRMIRASLSHPDDTPPSVSFQGLDLAFQPLAGGQPFGLESAGKVEFHLRKGPDDQGGVFVTVENGRARLTGLLGRIAGERPIAIGWNATLSKMGAFRGPDWPSAVRNWVDAGGKMTVRQAGVTAGEAVLSSNSGTLFVGADGRLRGVLDVTPRQAPRALDAMGQTGVIAPDRAEAAAAVAAAREGTGDTARATINFEAGQTTLGPVAVGPAPLVYRPR